jgi:hypothetical protein
MEADYDRFEIVCVIGGYKLVDAESYERRYRHSMGLILAPGYYLVHWPEAVRIRRFNELAVFEGPYRDRAQVQAVRDGLAMEPVGAAGAVFAYSGVPARAMRPEPALAAG